MTASNIARARALLASVYGAAFVATLDDHHVALLVMSTVRHSPGPACNDARRPATKDHRHA